MAEMIPKVETENEAGGWSEAEGRGDSQSFSSKHC